MGSGILMCLMLICGGKEKSASKTFSLTKIVGAKNGWCLYRFKNTLAPQHSLYFDVTRSLDIHRQVSY